MGQRRRWSDEEWAEEARYIGLVAHGGAPGPNFNSDWGCLRRYIAMKLSFCVEDLGPHHIWTTNIRKYGEMVADAARAATQTWGEPGFEPGDVMRPGHDF